MSEISIDISDIKIKDLDIETDESSNSIHFNLQGTIQDLTETELAKVSGAKLTPIELTCEVEGD